MNICKEHIFDIIRYRIKSYRSDVVIKELECRDCGEYKEDYISIDDVDNIYDVVNE